MNVLLILCLAADLAALKSEPNLERRSDLALDAANQSLDAARKAYEDGDMAKTKAALDEVREAVDVSYDALVETGKNPRNDKHFKRAELRTRELMRRLSGFAQTVSFDDRDAINGLRDHVADVHDNLLKGIMSKKKK